MFPARDFALALVVAAVTGDSLVVPRATAVPAASDTVRREERQAFPPSGWQVGRLSALGLRKVRVTRDGHPDVLVRPTFGSRGIGWGAIEGFPRRRPALIAGADWDSVKPPSNPIPWSEVQRLETAHAGRRNGAVTGGAIGLVVIGLPMLGLAAGIHSLDPRIDASSFVPIAVAFAIGGTLAGAAIGHVAIPAPTVWEPVALPVKATHVGPEAPPDSTASRRDR